MMAIPKLIPVEHIKQLEEKQQAKYQNMIESYEEAKRSGDELKARWLAVFRRSLSPLLACRQSGASERQYHKWRKTDPDFCRSVNKAIVGARDELLGSALVRATGYLREDPKTGEIETDATGKPIYHGASDTLAKELLRLDAEDGKSHADVVVNIDFGSLRGSPNVVQLPTKSGPATIEYDNDIEPDPAA